MSLDQKRIKQLSDSVASLSRHRTSPPALSRKAAPLKNPYLKSGHFDYEVLKKFNADTETANSVISVINSRTGSIERSSVKGVPQEETAESIAAKLNSRDGLLNLRSVMGARAETSATIAAKLNGEEGLLDAKVIRGLPEAARPETAESIAAKLNSAAPLLESGAIKDLPTLEGMISGVIKELKTGKRRLEARDILNLPQKKFDMGDQRWHGGGLSKVSHDATLTGSGTPSDPLSVVGSGSGVTVETPVGAVDGSNVTYTVTATPKWIVADASTYFDGAGYTLAGLTVTMDSPPFYAIRSIY